MVLGFSRGLMQHPPDFLWFLSGLPRICSSLRNRRFQISNQIPAHGPSLQGHRQPTKAWTLPRAQPSPLALSLAPRELLTHQVSLFLPWGVSARNHLLAPRLHRASSPLSVRSQLKCPLLREVFPTSWPQAMPSQSPSQHTTLTVCTECSAIWKFSSGLICFSLPSTCESHGSRDLVWLLLSPRTAHGHRRCSMHVCWMSDRNQT